MFKKILLSLTATILIHVLAFAQPVNVISVATGGRLNNCNLANPTVTATLDPSPGSFVSPSGVLTCTDPCDTSSLLITMTNIRWNQTPGAEWVHGLFFPSNSGYVISGITLPPGWGTYNNCTGAPCSGQISGGPGFYYDGTTINSCCGTVAANNGNPADNWGVGVYDCNATPITISFRMRVCNKLIISGQIVFRLRATSDGGTGCWSTPDPATNNTLDFTLATQQCSPLYNPLPVSTPTTKVCTPSPQYSTVLTGGCGNGNTVTWWNASVGGTQIGTGSPFVYTTSTCKAGTTVWASCCAIGGPNCSTRQQFNIAPGCPLTMTLGPLSTTQPDCTTPTGTITAPAPVNPSGPYTYTINPPGGPGQTSGTFGGLNPGTYTVTVTDAAGCTDSQSATINTPTGAGTAPTVTSPVNYCQNAAAVPISATGTNVLYYITATGGVGTAVAPTPSTTTVGTTTYYASQNPGGCESTRTPIVVNVTANSTVTLSSAAGTDGQNVCVNTPITTITYQTGAGATGATVAPLPAGVTFTYSGGTNGIVTITGTPTAAGSTTYTVTTTGGCGAATATGTITVGNAAAMVLTSPAATSTQTICINTLLTPIVYTISGGATGATLTPATTLPAGVTGVFSAGPGTFTISGTASVAGSFPYGVVTTGGCAPVTLTGTITVNNNMTVTLSSGAGTNTQTVCNGAPIGTTITYTTANDVTGATVTGLPTGMSGTYGGGTNGGITISGTPTQNGTFTYLVTPTGGCGNATATGTITVTPVPTITLTSAAGTNNPTLCANTALTTPITYTIGGSATGAAVTGLPTGMSGTLTGTTYTISGTPTGAAGAYPYTVITTGGCGTNPSLTGTVTVNAPSTLTLGATPANQTVCIGVAVSPNITYNVGGSATGATVTGLPTGMSGVYNAGVVTISGAPSVNAASPYTYTVATTGPCASVSLTGIITVSPATTLVLTSPAATANQTVNINTSITTITYTAGGGVTGAVVTGLPGTATGTYSGGTITISGNVGSTPGSYNYTVTTTGGCTVQTLTGTINVNDLAGLTLTSAPGTNAQTVCVSGGTFVNIVYQTSGGATGATITPALPAGLTGVYSGGSNGTYTISGNPSVTGTYNYTVSTTGGTGFASASGSITVTPNVTLTFTSGGTTNAQTTCINTALANSIVYTTGNNATGATVTGLPTGVNGVWTAGTGGTGTFTISGIPTVSQATPYAYTVTTTGGCSTASLSGTVTVNPNVTIALSSPAGTDAQTVCINAAITNIAYTTTNGVTSVAITGLPAGVTGSYNAGTGVYTISGSPTVSQATAYSYTLTTSGGCSSVTASGTILVNPNVVLTLGAAAANQTVCINQAMTTITYNTTNATGGTVTGLPTGVTGTFNAGGTITIDGIPTSAAGPYNYTVNATGLCLPASLTGTITVSPAATISLTSAAGSDAQTVCINTAIAPIRYTPATGATGAAATGLPAGVTANFAAGVLTIAGNPSAAGTTTYTVTSTGGCGTATLTGTITVSPDGTIATTGNTAQTVCIGTGITTIVYNTTNGVTGVNATGFPAGVSGVFAAGAGGTGTYTISGSPSVTQATPYAYNLTTAGGCAAATASGTILVNPNVTMSLTSAAATTNQTICINTAIAQITYSTQNGATGANFTQLPAGVTGTFTAGANGTGSVVIDGIATAAGTFNYSVQTTGGCGSVTLNGTIAVNPASTIILSSPVGTDAQSVCVSSGTFVNIVYNTANGITGATVAGLPAGVTGVFAAGTGGTGTVTISGNPSIAQATPYNYTITTTGGCLPPTATGTITVNPNVTMALTSAAGTDAQTVCINAATPMTNITYGTTNGVTGVTPTNLPAGVTGVFTAGTGGAGTYTISGTATASGTFNYSLLTLGGCSPVTVTGTITVNPAATVTLTSGAATAAQTVCVNTAITNIVYTGATGATGVTVTGLPTGVTSSLSGTVLTISGSPSDPTGSPYTYTVTTAGGCGTATLTGTITVNPDVTITLGAAPANQTVCINQAMTTITYNAVNATGATFTGLPAGVNGTFAAGTITIDGTPTVAGPFNYTVTATGLCASASLSGTITVSPAVTITLTSAASTTNQALCENTAINNITYSTANGATGITATGLPAGVTAVWSATTGTNGAVLISGTATTAGVYNYTITTTGGCATPSQSGTITVIAIPAAPTVTPAVNYCPGDAATPLTATGTNLLWYPTATGGIGSTTAPTPSTAVSGSVTQYYVSQSSTVASCESPRSLITVTVSNPLVISNLPDVTICQGDTARFIPTVTPPADTYQWTAVGGNGSTIISPNSLNTGVFPVDTTSYILRATLGGCSAQKTVTVNVRWKPIIDAGINVPICLNDSTLITGSVSHVSNAITPGTSFTYAWTPTDSVTTPNAISTFVHPTHSTWYKITGTATAADYGCDFTFFDSVKVVVQPVIHAFAGNDTIAAKNLPHQLHGSGGTTYLWSSPTAVFSNPAVQNPTVTLNDDANIYVLVKDAIGCSGRDTLFIQVFEGPAYYIPNAFTPNGDGLNDVFRPIPPGISSTTFFRVFNRYGQLMFETSQWLKGWDGTFKGKPAEPGAYVWIIKGVDKYNKTIEQKGTIMLIR